MRRRIGVWLRDEAPGPVRTAAAAAVRVRHRGRDQHEVWERELPHEVEFWKRFFLENPGMVSWRTDLASEVPEHSPLHSVLGSIAKEDVDVLDVGAGPLTCIGLSYPGKRLRIVATDPLAPKYDALLAELGIDPPVRTIAAEGELLEEQLGRDRFDLSCAINALDHCYDAAAVVANMVAVTRPGGHVVLWHNRNEAQHQLYRGLHQWNVDVADGHLVLWNANTRVDVSAELGDTVESNVWVEGDRVVADLAVRA